MVIVSVCIRFNLARGVCFLDESSSPHCQQLKYSLVLLSFTSNRASFSHIRFGNILQSNY